MPRRLRRVAIAGALMAPFLTSPANASVFPDVISLPDGFQPEGIAVHGTTAYLGSLADGDIYALNLLTGKGRVVAEGPGTSSVGLTLVGRYLYVAGDGTGTVRVIDTRTGHLVADYLLTTGPAFINDLIELRGAVYATNSQAGEIYRIPVTRDPAQAQPETITLSGDFELAEGFNLNGITTTPDRSALLAVQSATGTLFRIDPQSGMTQAVDLGGYALSNGDGLLTVGHTLYVVQNRQNKVAKIQLSHRGTSGRFVRAITDPDFDVPTTVARFGASLYLPNARFGTAGDQPASYTVVRVRAH